MKMKTTESIRNKFFNYNMTLMVAIVIVCTIYILINDLTIQTFNTTFISYNELNHFYENVNHMNESFQIYLDTPSTTDYTVYTDYKKACLKNIDSVKETFINDKETWRLEALKNMVNEYSKQAEVVAQANLKQGKEFSIEYQELLYEYELIAQTSSEYYQLATEDMQYQKEVVIRNQTKLKVLSMTFIIFIIGWLINFSNSTMKSITVPIEKIINNMNRIKKGKYDLTKISNTNQEMNILCMVLEDMAGKVRNNIMNAEEKAELEKRILEQQNESLKKDELLAQGELRVLQSQINPHFLFNTLNMIYKKAYSEGAYETSELMEKTSQLLRYSLDNANKISCLSNEITAIRNYMYIQEKRFGERIHFEIDEETNIPDIKMPTMVLQPLVENAVSHGLKDTIEDGIVRLEFTLQEKEIVISVSDNGEGMEADQLEKLVLNDFRVSDDTREHIGLYSVTRRLKVFYGDAVRILVNSMEECGFEIIIRIKLDGDGKNVTTYDY
ncbi:MAG: histidine kinase [Longicatena sp.]